MLKDTTLFTDIVKEDVNHIFSNIDKIYNLHLTFLGQLDKSFKNWPDSLSISFFSDFLVI